MIQEWLIFEELYFLVHFLGFYSVKDIGESLLRKHCKCAVGNALDLSSSWLIVD